MLEISGDSICSLLIGSHANNRKSIDDVMRALNLTYSDTKGMRKFEECLSDVLCPRGNVARENGLLWLRP